MFQPRRHSVSELDQINFQRRATFCEKIENLTRDPNYSKRICFSDEGVLDLKESCHSKPSTDWCSPNSFGFRDEQPMKVTFWAEILGIKIIGLFTSM